MAGTVTAPEQAHTLARAEHVYGLPRDEAERFAEHVSKNLPLDPHYAVVDPERPNRYVTTLYFDSAKHELASACLRDGHSVKLRAREYYGAQGASRIYRGPELWIEVKTRDGLKTDKLRCKVPAWELGELLRFGALTYARVASRRGRWGAGGEQVIDELLALLDRTDGELRPDSIAHYRRRAWQDPRANTRITLDTELAIYRPPKQLLGSRHAGLIDSVLRAEPVFEVQEAVVELKLRGPMPAWLRESVPRDIRKRNAFSKFLFASHIVAS